MKQSGESPNSGGSTIGSLITVIGVILGAFIGYLGIRYSIDVPMQATQTAEIKQTEYAYSSTRSQEEFQLTLTATSLFIPNLTLTPVDSITSSSEKTPTPINIVQAITGTWNGTTTGSNNNQPIAERLTNLFISLDCQIGSNCGFFNAEGACTYEISLLTVDDNIFEFEANSIDGEEFCYNDNSPTSSLELTLLSETELFFYYDNPVNVVIREGNLYKQ